MRDGHRAWQSDLIDGPRPLTVVAVGEGYVVSVSEVGQEETRD